MQADSQELKILDEELGFDLLKDLEQQTNENIKRQRTSERISIKAKVILQPGNASELLTFKVQGVTGDISKGGCGAIFPIPVHVGDIYRLTFDRNQLEIPMVFARCLRCRLVREDAYEAGFAFFTPIRLPEELAGTEPDDLL